MKKLRFLSLLCLFLCMGATAWAGDGNPTTLLRFHVTDNSQIKAGSTYVFNSNSVPARWLQHQVDDLCWNGEPTDDAFFQWTLEANPDNAAQFALKSQNTTRANKYMGSTVSDGGNNIQMQATPHYFEFDKIVVDGVVAGFALKDAESEADRWVEIHGTWKTHYTETQPVTINDAAVWTVYENVVPAIDRTNWDLTCSTWSPDGSNSAYGRITDIIDGDNATHWHSAYNDNGSGAGTSSLGLPQWFTIDMQSAQEIVKFGYARRSDGENGNCKTYKLYVSNHPFELTVPMTSETRDEVNNLGLEPVAEGSFTNQNGEQTVVLEHPVSGRYVLFVITDSYNVSGKHANCGEFNLYTYAPGYDVYKVVVEGAENVQVTHTNGNQAVNGGLFAFVAGTTLTAADFTASVVAFKTPTITIEDNTIKVTYTEATSHIRRESMPLPGNTYMIFNAGTTAGADWTGMLYYDGGVKVDKANKPSGMSSVADSYKWKVTKDDTGYKLYSATDLDNSISAAGALNGEYIAFHQYNTCDDKCGDDVFVLLEDELTRLKGSETNAEHRVFAIHNTQESWGWATNAGGMLYRHPGYFPYAFYTTYKYTNEQWDLYKQAKALIAQEGLIGCPKTDNEHGLAIKELLLQDPATADWTTNLTAKIAAYKAVTDVVMPTISGWYKVKSNRQQKYLFSESNNNPKNLTYINDGGDNSKYYWHVTFDNGQATVIGTTGLSMARGNQNGVYNNASVTYISPIALQSAKNGDVSWTEGYFLFPKTHFSTDDNSYTRNHAAYNSATNPYFLTTYASTADGNQYSFEPVSFAEGEQVYTVTIAHDNATGAAMSLTYNSDSYTGNKTVYNGGVYILSEAPAAADFTATELEGYTADVKVDADAKTITVYYRPNLKEGVLYQIICQGGSNSANKPMISDDADLRWGASTKNNQYWTLTAVEGGFKVKNGDGTYIYGDGTTENTNSDACLSMTDEAGASTTVFNAILGSDQWNINVNGQNDCHANHHSDNNYDSGSVICWEGNDKNSASAWKLVAVSGKDIYNVVAPDGGVITHTSTSGKAINGGFFVFDAGAEVTAAQFSATIDGVLAAAPTVDTENKTITLAADAKMVFTPSTGETDYYMLQTKNQDFYLYHEKGVTLDHPDHDALIGREFYEYASFYKITGNAADGYVLRSGLDENKCVYWMNTNAGEVNVGIATMGETLGDSCYWDIVPRKWEGEKVLWNIIPKGGTNGIRIMDHHYKAGLSSNNSGDVNLWDIRLATSLELAKAALITQLHQQQSNCLTNLFTQKKITSVGQLSTNADQNTLGANVNGDGLAGLLDRNRTTFFHSVYNGDSAPTEDHYLQVDFTEAVGDFCFYYYRRINNNVNRPTEIVVSGSTEAGGTYTDIVTFTSDVTADKSYLPTDARDELFLSDKIAGGDYKSLRFTVKATNNGVALNGHPCFTMAEFEVFNVPAALLPYQEVLRQTYPAMFEAIMAATTEDQLTAIREDLNKAVEMQTTTVVPVKRASELDPRKAYFIYNATKPNGDNKDAQGFIKYGTDGNYDVQWTKATPAEFKTSDVTYLWRVEKNDDGSYKLISYGSGKQVTALGTEGTDNVQIENYTTATPKCGDEWVTVWKEDGETTIAPSAVTAEDKLWAIHNGTTGWNGNSDGFKTATDAFEPFAFYEVAGYNVYGLEYLEIAKTLRANMEAGKVGYPKNDEEGQAKVKAVEDLAKADASATDWNENIKAAIDACYEDFQMPKSGHAYNVISQSRTGEKYYMNYTAEGYQMVAWNGTDAIPVTANLICREIADGQYAFVNNAGKFLMWRGGSVGNNSHKGYADAYDATNESSNTVLTIEKIVPDGNNVWGASHDFLGRVALKGNRNDGTTPNYFMITPDGSYNQNDNNIYYNRTYSSVFTFEEADYPATPTMKFASNLGTAVATWSAPYVTKAPEGVNVYTIKSQTPTTATVNWIGDDGVVIPAYTGVLLSGIAGEVGMLPATTEVPTADFSSNLLGNSAGSTDTDVAGKYILAKGSSGKYAFYPVNGSPAYLAMNKAYLDDSGNSIREIIFNFDATDLQGVEAVQNAEEKIYDLSGRRVQKATKGLYIRNGKKIILK